MHRLLDAGKIKVVQEGPPSRRYARLIVSAEDFGGVDDADSGCVTLLTCSHGTKLRSLREESKDSVVVNVDRHNLCGVSTFCLECG